MSATKDSEGSASSWQPHPLRFNFRRWFHRPCILQDWGDYQDERKVSWSELFYDLFMVAATINVTHFLIGDPTARGAGQFLLLYGIFYFVWNSHCMMVNRFRFEGLVFDTLNLLHHLAVLGMILGAQKFEWYARFAGSYAILRTITCIYQSILLVYVPRATNFCRLALAYHAVLVGLGWAAVFTTQRNFVAIFVVVLFLEALSPVIPTHIPAAKLPLHVEHTHERTGLIMMIYLGESIIQLGVVPLANSALQYAGIGFAATIVFCLHLIYFHNSPEQNDHAMRRSKYTGMAFHYLHSILGAAFLMCGSGLRLVLNAYVPHMVASSGGSDHRRRTLLEAVEGIAGDASAAAGGSGFAEDVDGVVAANAAWILCAGYSASLFIMLLIRMTHYLHFDKIHPMQALGHELCMTHWLHGWWLFGMLWPLAGIFIAFGAGDMGATAFLGYMCAHAVIYNLTETHITHTISSHPRWIELVVDTHSSAASSHASYKSSQGAGSLSTRTSGDGSCELIQATDSSGDGGVLKGAMPVDFPRGSDVDAKDVDGPFGDAKDVDAMENGDVCHNPYTKRGDDQSTAGADGAAAAGRGGGAAAPAGRAGRQDEGGRGGGTRRRATRRHSRSVRVLRQLLVRRTPDAWVEY